MTSGPSSTRIPAPSVLEIDRSKYPFSSPLFEPETTNGSHVQQLLDEKIRFMEGSELSYFEVADGKGNLYESLDIADDAVARFVYDTQRSPEVRILFVWVEMKPGGPLLLNRDAFIQLLEKTGVPPTFIEVYGNHNGALIGSPVYSDGDQDKVIAYHLLIRFPSMPFVNVAIYFGYNFYTRRTTCLVLGDDLDQLQNRFRQIFPASPGTRTPWPPHYPQDPFLVLSAIAAELVTLFARLCRRLTNQFYEQRRKVGMAARLFDRSLRVNPAALPSQIKELHLCHGRVVYFIHKLDFQILWVAFLQRQHRIVNEFGPKVIPDGADGNQIRPMKTESTATQKVSASLDLSASLLHNILSNLRALSRETQTDISILQSIISQLDSRTNISIAHDSKRIALDVKKDSVAMKTIAGLTMVFLPGTFTATFFSMVFFHVTDEPESRLTVNKHWWLYVAVTVPLTVLVLTTWLGWMRWKRRDAERR